MATLAEQLFQENTEAFEKVKAQLTENVMADIRKWGHHRIYFDACSKVDGICISRYPDGGDYTQIHPLLVRHAEQYLKEQGLNVTVDTWHDNNPKCIYVSI